jgi:hypothetical protein
MKLNDTAIGTMRNIIIGTSTDQVVGPLEHETLKLEKDIRPEYRAFVKQAMGGKDTFDLVDLDRRVAKVMNAIEGADGQGFWNLKNGKYNADEIARAAKRDAAVIPFVELVKASDKIL